MHQHHGAGLDTAQGLECRQGGGPVQHQAKGFRVGPAGRYGQRAGGGHRHVLREGTWAGSDDVGAELQRVVDIRTDAHDLAGGLEAGHVGGLWAAPVPAVALHDVREVDAGGADPDEVLTPSCGREGVAGPEGQVPRSAVRGLDECSYGVLVGAVHAATVGA
jgi:hypothetical protein